MKTNLQVISGKYRGLSIKFPASARPTAQRARGAIFNILESLLGDEFRGKPWIIWDAFAGSGAMGIEFFSRFSADKVIFSDKSAEAVDIINWNIQKLQGLRSIIKQAEANKITKIALQEAQKANLLIFIDPPYSEASSGVDLVQQLGKKARKGSMIVWEIENNYKLLISDDWEVLRDRVYGRARFLILRKISDSAISPGENCNGKITELSTGQPEISVDIDAIARRFVVGRQQIPGGGKYTTISAAANAIVAKLYPKLDVGALMVAMQRAKQR